MSKNLRAGDTAELQFDFEATKRGFNVSRPSVTGLRYDRIVEANGRMFRVQIKSSKIRGKYFGVMLTRTGGIPYSPSEIDVLAIHLHGSDQWHFIKPDVTKMSLSLGVKTEINNNWSIFTEWETL